jgi:thiamine transport system substrate-binding protein
MPTLPSLTEPFVIDPAMGFPAELQSKVLPFNWGVMAWMVDLKAYRELGVARPAEIGPEELLKWKGQWVVSDPRSSSPGMGFLRWLSGFPEWEVTLKNLSQTWRSLPTGWSQAYGLFLEGKAHTVWSYQTSEAYHRKQSTGGDRFVAIPPKGGAPRQIEVLFAWSPDSYEDLKWIQQILFAEGAQRWIPETQWMFPARAGTPLPESFSGISPFSGAPHFGNSSTSDRELLEKFEGSLWQR